MTNQVPPIIHLEFGSHHEQDSRLLTSLNNFMGSLLSSSPEGKVAFIKESIGFNLIESTAVSKWTQEGMLPSNALAQLDFFNQNARLPQSLSELKAWKKTSFHPDRFEAKTLQTLDSLASHHQRRVFVVPEWTPRSELETQPTEQAKLEFQESREEVLKGNFPKALPHYKNSITIFARQATVREQRLKDTIAKTASEPDIIAITGYFGSAHTRISHLTRSEGIPTQVSFPEQKKPDPYLFDPQISAIRSLRFFPNQYHSSAEWTGNMVASVAYNLLWTINRERARRTPDQDLIRITWQSFRDLSVADIGKLEADSKKFGFITALEGNEE